MTSSSALASPSSERSCPSGKTSQQVLAIANSIADRFGYERDEMFLELQGPMRWQTLAGSQSPAVKLHPMPQWNDQLADQCLWSVYFGCEPPHREFGGFAGCLDYPADLWLLIDNQNGKVLHTVRQTGKEWGYRIDH